MIHGFKRRKKKSSVIPGDLPPRIKKEFQLEIAEPITDIFNSITHTGEYPRQWVQEFVTPVNKIPFPETEDDLRPISITADLSRDYNKFIPDWLMFNIKDRIDPGQMGVKGSSTLHYLILLYNFILSNTDNSSQGPKPVLAVLIDFSKGFMRINHNKVLIRLSDWKVPGWLLKIVASYLTNRTMRILLVHIGP